MFEKCGLRDIFCKIAKAKWIMLIIIIIFTCIGALLFAKDYSAYKAAQTVQEEEGDKSIYGYAFYYLSVEEGSSTNARIKQLASNYISIMRLNSTGKSIYDSLLEKHSEEELLKLLGASRYEEGLSGSALWGSSYKLAYLEKGYILRLSAIAETKSMCKELLKICRGKLEKFAEKMPDSQITLVGVDYIRKAVSETEEKAAELPDYKKILVWLIIGIFIALLYAVISAVLRPVINRPEDFGLYGIRPVGLADKKTVPVLARLLEKETGGAAGSIAIATSLKNDKKVKEFTELLVSEWNKINDRVASGQITDRDGDAGQKKILISLAADPGGSAEAADVCNAADRVFTLERKGVTTHRRYDEMIHYLKLTDKLPEEALLIR